MFWADSFGAAAITIAWRMESGKSIAHCITCMPPRLAPTTTAHRRIPRRRIRRSCARVQSPQVTIGNSGPYGRPVAGLMVFGPVEPMQLPMLFGDTTKKRRVSIGLPGPMHASHQPGLRSSGEWYPAAW